jgi:hypothetical protein
MLASTSILIKPTAHTTLPIKLTTSASSMLHVATPFHPHGYKQFSCGHFATWPGLTANLVRKHLPKSIPTVLGLQHQQRQNIRMMHPILALANDDLTPVTELANIATHMVFSAITDTHNKIATDLTGQFPTVSGLGNQYILVCYVYDCNAILTTPVHNRSDTEHLWAFNLLHTYLVDCGFTPKHQCLDNKALAGFKSNL